jgi:hypothetical protein
MRGLSAGLLVFLLAASARAGIPDDRDIRLRVMATSVPVRSGPGGSFTEIGRVGRGQVYEAIDRSPDGAWYRIRLSRGVSGWVLSELVWPFEIVEEGAAAQTSDFFSRNILGPSRLDDGRFTLAVSGGVLDYDGFYTVRVGFQPSRHYLLELVGGQSAGSLGSLLVYHLELLVALGPWRSLVPFAAVGAGGATTLPHQDVEFFGSGSHPMVSAGGGLLVALRGAITLRLDARQIMLFTPDEAWSMLALSGGLMLAF